MSDFTVNFHASDVSQYSDPAVSHTMQVEEDVHADADEVGVSEDVIEHFINKLRHCVPEQAEWLTQELAECSKDGMQKLAYRVQQIVANMDE